MMPITAATRAAQLIAATKHGAYAGGREAPEHYIWRSMLARCCNPQTKSWKYYGQRGIEVCERWFTYENFILDIGPRPSRRYTLDRIDNDGDYEPGNCRWATRDTQQKNKTSTVWYGYDGRIQTASEWADELGISRQLACWRIKHKGTFQMGKKWEVIK